MGWGDQLGVEGVIHSGWHFFGGSGVGYKTVLASLKSNNSGFSFQDIDTIYH